MLYTAKYIILSVISFAFLIPFILSCYESDQLLISSNAQCLSETSILNRELCKIGHKIIEDFLKKDFDCVFKRLLYLAYTFFRHHEVFYQFKKSISNISRLTLNLYITRNDLMASPSPSLIFHAKYIPKIFDRPLKFLAFSVRDLNYLQENTKYVKDRSVNLADIKRTK